MYDLVGDGYSKVHVAALNVSGSNLDLGAWTGAAEAWASRGVVASSTDFTGTNARMAYFDPQVDVDIATNALDVIFLHIATSALTSGSAMPNGDVSAVDQIALFGLATASVGTGGAVQWGQTYQAGSGVLNLRRLNKRGDWDGANFTLNPLNGAYVQFVLKLTSILSEQIALEIDREILNDLVTQANGANFFWSRAPGKFVNKLTGAAQTLASSLSVGPQFTGTVREWYETLIETIIDVANTIHRKTLRGSANFVVVGPDVATIMEASVLYKPKFSIDGEGQVGSPFTIGAEAIGTLSNRFTVYKDPYFVRNRVLVGYKGGSYLETGYVYSPYVPLIVTPTIFAPEDFSPRKGVMTRYGKKM